MELITHIHANATFSRVKNNSLENCVYQKNLPDF
jgi:hypothetical protein